MERVPQIVVLLLICGFSLKTALAQSCAVESSDCKCTMPKLYDCPTVDLTLVPDPDGCHLLKRELSTREFSNITCGNDTSLSNGVTFEDAGSSLVFTNVDCMTDFYFVVFLDGGQLVKTLTLEAGANTDSTGVNFEVAYGYTVPCNDQPTVNTLLWQYITPGYYAPNADIALVWNELNFTDGTFRHVEETYFKASYLFVHFGNVSTGSSFKLQITGCNEIAKDIDPALSYLNNLEVTTERELKKDGWKINEQRKVTRTFVRVEAAE